MGFFFFAPVVLDAGLRDPEQNNLRFKVFLNVWRSGGGGGEMKFIILFFFFLFSFNPRGIRGIFPTLSETMWVLQINIVEQDLSSFFFFESSGFVLLNRSESLTCLQLLKMP